MKESARPLRPMRIGWPAQILFPGCDMETDKLVTQRHAKDACSSAARDVGEDSAKSSTASSGFRARR
jgi:hypothetical protein